MVETVTIHYEITFIEGNLVDITIPQKIIVPLSEKDAWLDHYQENINIKYRITPYAGSRYVMNKVWI